MRPHTKSDRPFRLGRRRDPTARVQQASGADAQAFPLRDFSNIHGPGFVDGLLVLRCNVASRASQQPLIQPAPDTEHVQCRQSAHIGAEPCGDLSEKCQIS